MYSLHARIVPDFTLSRVSDKQSLTVTGQEKISLTRLYDAINFNEHGSLNILGIHPRLLQRVRAEEDRRAFEGVRNYFRHILYNFCKGSCLEGQRAFSKVIKYFRHMPKDFYRGHQMF